MTVTAQATAAKLTRRAARALNSVAAATPSDKWSWEPLENGRTILDQLQECCLANMK